MGVISMSDVFLITIDALRQDHFNRDYFPECWDNGFEDFAHFPNAYSNGVATPLSFPSIHTGYPVESDGELRSDTPTLAELYDGFSFAISNNPHLRPDRGYNRGFDSFTRRLGENSTEEDPLPNYVYNRAKGIAGKSETLRRLHNLFWDIVRDTADSQPDLSPPYNRTAEAILSELKSSIQSHSGFFWAHLMDSHYPYYPQKVTDKEVEVEHTNKEIRKINEKMKGPAARSMRLDKKGKELPPPTDDEIVFCRRIYAEIVKYLDRKISTFFKYIKNEGRWDESMIILMADHGEAFGEEGVFQHDWSANPIDSLVKVPLAVKYIQNQFAGNSYSHPVQTGDLFATLAEILEWDTELPPHTLPFTDTGYRPIISKSNNAIRVTTSDGYAIRRGDSVIKTVGNVDDRALSILRESSLSKVASMSGEIPGVENKQQEELEDRLEHLGYK
jgi:arylsulfatase A-like enzyme